MNNLLRTPEHMAEMREKARQNYQKLVKYQQDNTHSLPNGYTCMPTIQRDGVGWELHPPKEMQNYKGWYQEVSQGSIWYLRNREECESAVPRHKEHFKRSEATLTLQEV